MPWRVSLRLIGLAVVAVLGSSIPAFAQENRCADCHFANPQSDPYPEHLDAWDRSPHGRNGVGCNGCHKGNPSSFEPFIAHQGILTSGNPASPVHRTNLPRTCGACHIGPFVGFQKSRHFQLLSESDDGPTCTTCHDSVSARLLSPRALEQRCQSCHGENGSVPNPEFPRQARALLERVDEVRELLRPVPGLIRRVEGEERRSQLQYDYEQAQVPLTEAVNAGHEFVFDNMNERLTVARERAEHLLDQLTNPGGR